MQSILLEERRNGHITSLGG